MANSETVDLMGVGSHCAHPDCRQLDFLPFKCSRCSKVYCLDHRVCPCATESQQVVVCPLCARAVIISRGEDVELVFDRHTRTECDPSNYEKVHRKPRCPAGTCREKLTSTNSYTCRECGVTVCLKHRLPADHQCAGKAATTAAAATGRLNLSQSFRRMFSSGGTAAAAAPARPQVAAPRQQQQQQPSVANGGVGRVRTMGQKAAAAATRSTENLQSQLQQYRQRQRGQGAPGAAPAAGGRGGGGASEVIDLTSSAAPAAPAGAETCPQCGARFGSVQQLIEHAETAHAGGWSSGAVGMQQQQPAVGRGTAGGGGGSGLERCPHCGRQFADAVELVMHVERQHATVAAGGGGASRENCVLS